MAVPANYSVPNHSPANFPEVLPLLPRLRPADGGATPRRRQRSVGSPGMSRIRARPRATARDEDSPRRIYSQGRSSGTWCSQLRPLPHRSRSLWLRWAATALGRWLGLLPRLGGIARRNTLLRWHPLAPQRLLALCGPAGRLLCLLSSDVVHIALVGPEFWCVLRLSERSCLGYFLPSGGLAVVGSRPPRRPC